MPELVTAWTTGEGRVERLLRVLARTAARVVTRFVVLREILRRMKFKGRGRIIDSLRPAFEGTECTTICGQYRFSLKLRDDIQWKIYFNDYDDGSLARIISDLVPRGGLCLDIGANVGFYTLRLAQAVGLHGSVHAFEPDPNNADRLQRNILLNGFTDRVTVHQLAVTDRPGLAPFYQSSARHSGWGSLAEFSDIAVGRIEIPTTTIDDFLEQRQIVHVDFVKSDVEAYEFELLRGASRTLSSKRIRYLLLEFNGIRLAQRGHTLAGLLELLVGHGYVPVRLNCSKLEDLRAGRQDPEKEIVDLLFEPKNR